MKFSKTKLVVLLSCSVLSISFFATSVFADNKLTVNNVVAQKQEQKYWCWAATSSMLAKALGATKATQSAIVSAVFGSPYDVTGTVYDMQTGLKAFNINSTPLTATIPFNTMVTNLDNNKNMIASVLQSAGGGHALAVYGYYYNTATSTQNLYFYDPIDATSNVQAYTSFKSNSKWTWKESLTVG